MPKVVTESERAQKQRVILDAAATEIARYGYDRANINTIAERAGIGRGTIYLYFASKEAVLDALLETIGAMIDEAVRISLEGEQPWRERLHRLAHQFAALARDHSDFFRVHVSALYGVNRDIGAPVARWLRTSAQRLATALTAAAQSGDVRVVAPESVATIILGLVESLALLPSVLGQDGKYLDTHADTLADLLWLGIAPSS